VSLIKKEAIVELGSRRKRACSPLIESSLATRLSLFFAAAARCVPSLAASLRIYGCRLMTQKSQLVHVGAFFGSHEHDKSVPKETSSHVRQWLNHKQV